MFVTAQNGVIAEVRHKNGSTSMKLAWNKDFCRARNKEFESIQEYVDSECIRCMKPYTPMLNGVLYKSAALGTVIGSGEIRQAAPYARYQYYGKLMVSSVTGSSYAAGGEKKVLTDIDLAYQKSKHPQAGKLWFERMKADHKKRILAGAKRKAGVK